jgi:hypothetical protein
MSDNRFGLLLNPLKKFNLLILWKILLVLSCLTQGSVQIKCATLEKLAFLHLICE